MAHDSALQLKALRDAFQNTKTELLAELETLLRFQSISLDPTHREDINDCANWIVQFLRDAGIAAELWQAGGNPTVFAQIQSGPEKPTLLLYGHYDVQPAERLDEWQSPPFEPTIRDGEIYARGAFDNKGQLFYVIAALRHLVGHCETLPINVKLVIEGEEETRSHSLHELVTTKRAELSADYLAVVDAGMLDIAHPSVTLGVRGIVSMDVAVHGPIVDLHSGSHGGVVVNPIHALAKIIAGLHDDEGRVTVPHFYDDVHELSEEEKRVIDFSVDESWYESQFRTKLLGGERNYSALERAWTRPTIEVNGIVAGYNGPNIMGVIPAVARAKISCRLVPDQSPERIASLVAAQIESLTPPGVRCEITHSADSGPAVRADHRSAIVRAMAQACEDVFEKPCRFLLEGGSVPITAPLVASSGAEPVLFGLGLPTDNMHGPNEHFGIDRLELGFLIICRLIANLSRNR